MLFCRVTWRELHDSGPLEWDVKIPAPIQELTKLTLYSFFLEMSYKMPRYNFSGHPKTKNFLVGLTDASLSLHSFQIFFVSILHDPETTRVTFI